MKPPQHPQHLPNPSASNNQRVTFAGDALEIQFPPGWYENAAEHPYDLQYFSGDQRMNTGVFLYKAADLASDITPQDVFLFHIDDLQSKRQNFEVVAPETSESLADKTLTTAVYAGDKDSARNFYKFTLVEFTDDPDQILVILQVAIPSEWDKNQPILEEITRSMTIVSTGL